MTVIVARAITSACSPRTLRQSRDSIGRTSPTIGWSGDLPEAIVGSARLQDRSPVSVLDTGRLSRLEEVAQSGSESLGVLEVGKVRGARQRDEPASGDR